LLLLLMMNLLAADTSRSLAFTLCAFWLETNTVNVSR